MHNAVSCSPPAEDPSEFTLLNGTFFIWGVLTSLTSVVVPLVRDYFLISEILATFVPMIFFLIPLVACLPFGAAIPLLGYKKSLGTSHRLSCSGTLLVCVGFMLTNYFVFLLGIVFVASGVAAMQVVANPYLASLVAPEKMSGTLSFASSLNSFGTVVSPVAVSALIFVFAKFGGDIGTTLVAIYLLITSCLGLMIYHSKKQKVLCQSLQAFEQKESAVSLFKDLLGHKRAVFGCTAIFFYVGAEVAIAINIVNYLSSDKLGGLSLGVSIQLIAAYWTFAMLGRYLYSRYSHSVKGMNLVIVGACVAISVILLAVVSGNLFGGILLLLIGLCNSIVYPMVFSNVLSGIKDSLTPIASSLLIMCGVGGAIIPMAQTLMAESFGLKVSFLAPALCYLYLLFYSVKSR